MIYRRAIDVSDWLLGGSRRSTVRWNNTPPKWHRVGAVHASAQPTTWPRTTEQIHFRDGWHPL